MFELLTTAIIALVVFVILAVIAAQASKSCRESFNRKWPPITDDEFVAKCSPRANPQTALKVRRIISEQLGVPYERIHPDQGFVNDLDCC